MGETQEQESKGGAIVGGELQQWAQLPYESAAAYAGFTACADLPPARERLRFPTVWLRGCQRMQR